VKCGQYQTLFLRKVEVSFSKAFLLKGVRRRVMSEKKHLSGADFFPHLKMFDMDRRCGGNQMRFNNFSSFVTCRSSLFSFFIALILLTGSVSFGQSTPSSPAPASAAPASPAPASPATASAATASAATESERALHQGDPERAAALAEKRLKTHPNDAAARLILARAVLAQGKFQQAYLELKNALKANPRNIEALYFLSIVANALSQTEFAKLYSLAPESDRVNQLLGEAALLQEKQTEAESEFLAALKINPRSVESLTALGELKRAQSKFDEAIEYYSRAEAVGPLSYDITYGLGACYTYKQEHERAIAYFRKALTFDPRSGAGRFALGNALFQSGRIEAAIPELQSAIALEPKLKQVYFLLGRAYQRLGRQVEAREAFKKLDELTKEEFDNIQGKKRP
jgi:tetratricopeptide (TPR) repeat protein